MPFVKKIGNTGTKNVCFHLYLVCICTKTLHEYVRSFQVDLVVRILYGMECVLRWRSAVQTGNAGLYVIFILLMEDEY